MSFSGVQEYTSAHLLLNLLNEEGKREKNLRGFAKYYIAVSQKVDKLNSTGAQLLDDTKTDLKILF